LGDLVPESRRGRFFALRTQLSSVSSFAALLGAGLVLQLFSSRWSAYGGFVSIFLFAMLARLISAYHLARMIDPPRSSQEDPLPARGVLSRLRGSPLVRFSMFFASMQFSVAIAGPFFVVYMLRDLHFSYLEWTINSAVSVCFQFLTLNRWGRLSDIFGNRLILLTTGSLLPIMPMLWIVSTNYFYLLLVQAISGLVWAGFTLAATNFLFDLTPPERRATLMAYHNVLAAMAVFAGALIGGYLGTALPSAITLAGYELQWTSALYGVFLISGISRMIVAGSFLPGLKEVRNVRPMTMSGVIFRVTRFRPAFGLMFDIVPFRQKRGDDDEGDAP
ncbi:MAG: MFS transporter, partial [Pseudomonadales bacterium]|nr:MFS transporter [Pseudomonadales bacterium]